jgi:hypothetical protein
LDENRLDDLRRRLAADQASAAARPSLGELMRGCAPLGLKQCDADGGWLTVGEDQLLLWQVQRGVTDEDGITGAALLLAGGAEGPLTPVAWTRGAFFKPPTVFRRPDGTDYVVIPGVYGGTGRGSADVLFRWTPGAERSLTQIDNESWRDGLETQLPKGLGVWKGVIIDYEEMIAFTPLWRDDDGNCCPSGGSAILDFDIQDDRLILTGVNVRPDAMAD